MRKTETVTAQNLAAIYGHIKKLLEACEYFTERTIPFCSKNKINRVLHQHGEKEGPIFEKGQQVLSKRRVQFVSKIDLKKDSIVVYNLFGDASTISVGDKVQAHHNMVKIKSGINNSSPLASFVRVWTLDELPAHRVQYNWDNMTMLDTEASLRNAIVTLLPESSKDEIKEKIYEEYGYPDPISITLGLDGNKVHFMGNARYLGKKEPEKRGEIFTFTGSN